MAFKKGQIIVPKLSTDLGDGTVVHNDASGLVADDVVLRDVNTTAAHDATVTVVVDSISADLHLQLQ